MARNLDLVVSKKEGHFTSISQGQGQRATYYCHNNNSAAIHSIFNRQLACQTVVDDGVLRRFSAYMTRLSESAFSHPLGQVLNSV